ncbi:MAG: biotin--[acetyl-CoA-carboxylase] ligase [Planctomycetota bacterium]|nr:MAG: biotin--[acetyl-CoA-carboxylase] ligase [Planctomycetota bacterium]REK31064.1 MAG: biotin--[acetyl-CoA-carboxylase] ligase [Planctomycetota bacterium]REK36823.1 MAG: biotin--[acetyl-CoA-carboxylase] ligase [Planctomycetota bacterium]
MTRPDVDPQRGIDPHRIERETYVNSAEVHEELPSTNDHALKIAAGSTPPQLIAALRQTFGRGRGSNRWWAADGALTFSLIIETPAVPIERLPQVSLTAGSAIADAVQSFVTTNEVRLKWPNDVYLSGRKAAGILVEVPPGVKDRLVIGVGVNVNNSLAGAPDDVRKRGAALCESAGRPLDLTDVLVAILQRLETDLSLLAHSSSVLAERWRSLCLLTGRSVTLNDGTRAVTGTCRGIEDDGALLIETIAGPMRYYGGVIEEFG